MSEKLETSIAIKKCWIAPIAADGGCGTDWMEIQLGQREGTLKFNGASADTTRHKGVTGNTLARSLKAGEKTLTFQLADLTPDIIAMLTGGTSSVTADGNMYAAPLEENQDIAYSFRILSGNMVLFSLPHVALDSYPMADDDDLHYYTIEGTLITPEKRDVPIYEYLILKTPSANAITAFTIGGYAAVATINAVAKTVAIALPAGTLKTALVPHVTTSPGASISPITGVSTDFTSPVVYKVTSANGTEATWTVTVSIAV